MVVRFHILSLSVFLPLIYSNSYNKPGQKAESEST